MKKVILISFFQSNNMGDRLIAKREKEMFEENYEVVCVDFSAMKKHSPEKQCMINSPSSYKRKIKSYFTKFSVFSYIKVLLKTRKLFESVLEQEKDAEIVILAGGNMIMDMTLFPIYTLKSYIALKTAKKSGKKTALMFVGAGPIQNFVQKTYVKKIIGLCDYISVRDKNSKELLNSIVPQAEVIQLYDPVLSVEGHISERANAVGVSVFFGTNARNCEKVKIAYKKIIKEIRKKLPSHKIILFSSEMTDYTYVNELYEEFDDENIIVRKIETENELLDIYSEFDILLGARMHSLITSLVMRTPVIGFCWQEKVWGLSETVDMKERFYPIDKLDCYIGEIAEQTVNILNDLENETIKIDKKLKEISERTKKSLEDFKERF